MTLTELDANLVPKRRRGRPPKRFPVKPKAYPEHFKMEVCAAYLMTGTVGETAKIMGVDPNTIRGWMAQDWWTDYSAQLRVEIDFETETQLTGVVNKAIKTIRTRLEEGDVIYNPKLDKFVTKPVSARDAAFVANMGISRRTIIRESVDAGKNQGSTEEMGRLLKLAKEFSRFVKSKEVAGVVLNVPDGERNSGTSREETSNGNGDIQSEEARQDWQNGQEIDAGKKAHDSEEVLNDGQRQTIQIPASPGCLNIYDSQFDADTISGGSG